MYFKTDISKILSNKISDIDSYELIDKLHNLKKENNIFENNVYDDLEIFNSEESIFEVINKTKTTFGNIYLKHILNNPINDITTLKYRQDVLNKITNEKIKEIDICLDKIKEIEPIIVWILREKNEDEQKILSGVYFTNKYLKFLNENEDILSFYSFFKILFAPIYGLISPIIFFVLPYIYLYYFSKIKIPLNTYIQLFKATIFGGFNLLSTNSSITKYFSIILSLIIYIQNFFNTFKEAKNTYDIINVLHLKIKALNKFINTTNELNKLTKDIFKNNTFKDLDTFNLIFDAEPSILSNKGKILKTFNNLDKFKENSKMAFDFIGNIDSFFSIKKLINELESKNLNISYCKYLNNDKPCIIIKDIWHPYLSKLNNTIISNSINLGADHRNNVILTGPNAGGKSTFIKSISISLLFIHTFGISFSKESNITPFSLVNTYLNIPDCKGKESLFEAEMNRSKNYLEKLDNLKTNEFSFIIMDEIFSSTNPKEGLAGAYAICNKLSTFQNSIAIVTTHFSKLTNLEETNDTFTNYNIPISRNQDEDIVYPYKIQKGSCSQFIALELLKKKGFNKEIIEDAIKICDKL